MTILPSPSIINTQILGFGHRNEYVFWESNVSIQYCIIVLSSKIEVGGQHVMAPLSTITTYYYYLFFKTTLYL